MFERYSTLGDSIKYVYMDQDNTWILINSITGEILKVDCFKTEVWKEDQVIKTRKPSRKVVWK